MTFDVYDTFEDDYIAYERTLTPDGCESSPVVEAIVVSSLPTVMANLSY